MNYKFLLAGLMALAAGALAPAAQASTVCYDIDIVGNDLKYRDFVHVQDTTIEKISAFHNTLVVTPKCDVDGVHSTVSGTFQIQSGAVFSGGGSSVQGSQVTLTPQSADVYLRFAPDNPNGGESQYILRLKLFPTAETPNTFALAKFMKLGDTQTWSVHVQPHYADRLEARFFISKDPTGQTGVEDVQSIVQYSDNQANGALLDFQIPVTPPSRGTWYYFLSLFNYPSWYTGQAPNIQVPPASSFTALSTEDAPVVQSVSNTQNGATAALSANVTDPNNLALTYTWSIDSLPPTSTAASITPNGSSAMFSPDVGGQYKIKLVANNGYIDSAPYYLLVDTNTWDLPALLVDAHVNGLSANLNAYVSNTTSSSVSFTWAVVSQPAGVDAQIQGTGKNVSINSTAGDYVVSVIAHADNKDSLKSQVKFTLGNGSCLTRSGLRPMQDAFKQTCGSGSAIGPTGGANNTQNCTQSCTAHPVNIASGSHWDRHTDFSLATPTAETTLEFSRNYAAFAAAPVGGLGPNWRHNWETMLVSDQALNGRAEIIWIDENGGPWLFVSQNDGSYSAPLGTGLVLTEFSDHFELKKRDLTKLFFSKGVSFGKLQKLQDRHGVEVVLSYDSSGVLQSVTAPMAGALLFTYDNNGHISQVTRSRDSLSYTFAYNSDGRLVSVTDFAGQSYQYDYNTSQPNTFAQGMLSKITDPVGRTDRFFYYDDGRVSRQIEAGGGVRTFTYDLSSTTVKETDGTVTTFTFDSAFRTTEFHQVDGSEKTQAWNSAGYRASTTDELGNTTNYTYDANGNVASIKRPADSAATSIVYDQTFNVPTLLTPVTGAPTSYTLDPNTGDILQVSRSDGSTTLALHYTRDAFGNIVSINNGLTTYSNQRDSSTGLLTQVFDLHNPETRSYDSRHRLASRNFASGRVLTYSYDDFDRPTTIHDSHGPTISYTYDAVGRVLTESRSDGQRTATTTFVWDKHDRLVSKTDALGNTTQYIYDTKRILKDPIAIVNPKGNLTTFTYDKRGRMLTKTEPLGATTKYSYNARGDLVSVTDALGNVTSFEYDANGRKTAEYRPSLIGSTAKQLKITYTYDGVDELLEQKAIAPSNSGHDRIQQFTYDAFGRLVQRTLKTGTTVEDSSTYSYAPELDAQLLTSANNGVGNLGFGRESAPPFASIGFTVQANGSAPLDSYNLAIGRDVTGNIASVGSALVKSYDPAGRLLTANSGAFSAALTYDGFGRRATFTGPSEQELVSYDLLDRVRQLEWKGTVNYFENLHYDANGNIFELYNQDARYQLGYDSNDQLVASKGQGIGSVPVYNRSFEYDGLGNRLGDSANGPGNFVSNFLLKNATSTFTANPEGFGDVVRELGVNFDKNYFYRADGKIAGFTQGLLTVAYFYDALDRLVGRSINDGTSTFWQTITYIADEQTVLFGKAGDGSITTYIDGQGVNEHLGEVKGSAAKAYVADHLGSVLNAEAAGDWHRFGFFGESTSAISGISASSPAVSWGWQGLTYETASGDWNNRARQYLATSATFASLDPLGIASGEVNLYSSRRNNPLKYVDSTGENPVVIAIAGAAAAQGLASFVTTYAVTKNFKQALEAGKQGAIAGGLAGFLAVAGGATAVAAGAAVVIDVGYSLLNAPSSVDDPAAFKAGLRAIVKPKTACSVEE